MNQTIEFDKGHRILSRTGKRVLRPGGKELTLKMLDALHISTADHLVEFAPGTGYTAQFALKYHPGTYTGIELDEEAAALFRKKLKVPEYQVLTTNAKNTGLPDNFADKVYGEAMLTMHADHRKTEIMKEACRILKKNGLYAIHELGLSPEDISDVVKKDIQKRLARLSKVNARPLTESEWVALMESSGFKVKEVFHNPMKLLEIRRVVQDEGLFHTLQIGFNIASHPKIRKRVLDMRKVFKSYRKQLQGIVLIAEKR